jgi:hypothetical protein
LAIEPVPKPHGTHVSAVIRGRCGGGAYNPQRPVSGFRPGRTQSCVHPWTLGVRPQNHTWFCPCRGGSGGRKSVARGKTFPCQQLKNFGPRMARINTNDTYPSARIRNAMYGAHSRTFADKKTKNLCNLLTTLIFPLLKLLTVEDFPPLAGFGTGSIESKCRCPGAAGRGLTPGAFRLYCINDRGARFKT